MSKKVVLGQEVFVLSPQGDVICTKVAGIAMVAGIGSESYDLLNGYSSDHPHWFSFDEAIGAARNCLEARREKLRKALRQLAARDREFQKDGYWHSVLTAPYKMVDLGYDETRRFRSRTRKKISVPETYMQPGQCVFAIITPATLPHGDGWVVYRPYKHFILETYVKSVWLSPDGTAHYGFSTPLKPEEFFLSRKEATERLQSYSEPGTLEQINFVSKAREMQELEKLRDDDDIPF